MSNVEPSVGITVSHIDFPTKPEDVSVELTQASIISHEKDAKSAIDGSTLFTAEEEEEAAKTTVSAITTMQGLETSGSLASSSAMDVEIPRAVVPTAAQHASAVHHGLTSSNASSSSGSSSPSINFSTPPSGSSPSGT